jgi:hypothetical protein
VVWARVCKLCGQGFELEYRTGRPREYCFTCQPEGWKIVLPKHRLGRVKLRRVTPYRGVVVTFDRRSFSVGAQSTSGEGGADGFSGRRI